MDDVKPSIDLAWKKYLQRQEASLLPMCVGQAMHKAHGTVATICY